MRKTLYLLIVGALVTSVASLTAAPAADKERDAAAKPAVRPLALPPGVEPKDLKEAGDVRNAYEVITEAAFESDAFDDVVVRLVDADRNRIAKWKDRDFKALEDRIGALKRIWKDKYGKDPGDVDEKLVFGEGGYVAIATGEIADPAKLVGKWPVMPLVSDPSDARTAAAKEPGKAGAPADTAQQTRDAGKPAGGDVNLDKGRNVAVARYPAGHGMPALDASLIHEAPDIWRFDIPDNLDGKRLHDNLLSHLNMLGDGSNWPSDPKEGYRMVAHHVLMALYDVNPEKAAKDAAERKAPADNP